MFMKISEAANDLFGGKFIKMCTSESLSNFWGAYHCEKKLFKYWWSDDVENKRTKYPF